MLAPMELRGRHVALRPLTTRDAEMTLRWRLDDRASLLNRGAATVEEQRAWIAARPESERNFIIELLDGRPVGMLSLIAIDLVHRRAEPARFLIGEPQLVRGVPAAVEAMLLLYRLAFDDLGLHRVYGTVAEENAGMVKWQTFLGMTEEGRLREHYRLDGRVQDAICLGMLEHEYRTVALPRMTALVGAASVDREPAAEQ